MTSMVWAVGRFRFVSQQNFADEGILSTRAGNAVQLSAQHDATVRHDIAQACSMARCAHKALLVMLHESITPAALFEPDTYFCEINGI